MQLIFEMYLCIEHHLVIKGVYMSLSFYPQNLHTTSNPKDGRCPNLITNIKEVLAFPSIINSTCT